MYPSKRGFLYDKIGIAWNLLAARFCFREDQKNPKQISPMNFIRPANFVPVLFIGDSIIRFLNNMFENVHVISLSGGKLLDCYHSLVQFLEHANFFVVIFHSGTNDINKTMKPENIQMQNAERDLHFVMSSISNLQRLYKFSCIFSGCLYTSNETINLRVDRLNEIIKDECKKLKFLFVDNSNISSTGLRDVVHLNITGETDFVKNFNGLL